MALVLFSHFSLGLGGAAGTLVFSGWACAQAQASYRTDGGLEFLLGMGYGGYASTSMFGEGESGQGPFFRATISKDLGGRCCGGPPGVIFGFIFAALQDDYTDAWRHPWAFQAGISVPLMVRHQPSDFSLQLGQIYTTINIGNKPSSGFTLTSVGLGLDLWFLNWE
jgi:hypothetical protein